MMRIGAYLRRQGMEQLDRWYEVAGKALHEEGRKPHRPDVAEALLAEMGLDPAIVPAAIEDPTTGDEVKAEHDMVVAKGGFGVPTLVFDDGQALFGPVLVNPPPGEEAVRLWDHVTGWLEFPTSTSSNGRRPPPTSTPSPPPSPPTSRPATGSASSVRRLERTSAPDRSRRTSGTPAGISGVSVATFAFRSRHRPRAGKSSTDSMPAATSAAALTGRIRCSARAMLVITTMRGRPVPDNRAMGTRSTGQHLAGRAGTPGRPGPPA